LYKLASHYGIFWLGEALSAFKIVPLFSWICPNKICVCAEKFDASIVEAAKDTGGCVGVVGVGIGAGVVGAIGVAVAGVEVGGTCICVVGGDKEREGGTRVGEVVAGVEMEGVGSVVTDVGAVVVGVCVGVEGFIVDVSVCVGVRLAEGMLAGVNGKVDFVGVVPVVGVESERAKAVGGVVNFVGALVGVDVDVCVCVVGCTARVGVWEDK
jgi:hypothetical protein